MPVKSDLTLHWVIVGFMLLTLLSYNIICHVATIDLQLNLSAEERELTRSIFYIIAILLFPLVNLLRHILLRLNQTMPGDTPAKKRYLITTLITLSSIEIVGFFGLVMFMLGDGYNTLYIFSSLALLGLFLHRPQQEEYQQIIDALNNPER